MTRCKRHDWFAPVPGGRTITCRRCGRELRRDEIHELAMHAILKGLGDRPDRNLFRGFFGIGPLATLWYGTGQTGESPEGRRDALGSVIA